MLRLVEDLLDQPMLDAAPATDLGVLLEEALRTIRRRSLVVIVSDFISAPGWERSLHLLNQRHELLAVRLVDPREVALPDVGTVVIQDAETGEQLEVDTNDRAFRERFAAAAQAREAAINTAIGRRRGGRHDAVHRGRPRPGHRPDGLPPAPPEAAGMTFLWPPLLLAVLLVPLGLLAAIRRIERRPPRAASRPWSVSATRARRPRRDPRRRLLDRLAPALGGRRDWSCSSSRWPGPRRRSPCRASRAP